jgi:hypothetical protein
MELNILKNNIYLVEYYQILNFESFLFRLTKFYIIYILPFQNLNPSQNSLYFQPFNQIFIL